MASSSKRSWKLQEFTAHEANVNCLALGHKSGRVLVTGGDDKKVNLWAVGKQNCIMSLSGHSTPIEAVRFNYTEELVCAGSQTGAIKIWDLEAAKLVRTLTGHKGGIKCSDFHPYGDFLASGSHDTVIKLWDTRRKGCIFTYRSHRMTVTSLKFSPDGQWIASGGEEGSVKVWDLRMGRILKEFTDHGSAVTSVEFHPNEFLLASGSADRTVNFWELESFQLVSTERDAGSVRCLTFHPGGECLYTGSTEGLRVLGWEPARTIDTVSIAWGRVQDIATAQNQLIGASYHMANILLYVVVINKIQPFGDSLDPQQICNTTSTFTSETVRRSFSRERPVALSPKSIPQVKTIEESTSGTDPEEDAGGAEITNVTGYKEVFQPNRSLTRTPPPAEPFLEPSDDMIDPTKPQILLPISHSEPEYLSLSSLEMPSSGSASLQHQSHSLELPNAGEDIHVHHSKSPPPQGQQHASSFPTLSTSGPNYNRNSNTTQSKPLRSAAPPVPVDIYVTPRNNGLGNNKSNVSNFGSSGKVNHVDNDEKIRSKEYVPVSVDKPVGLDFSDFLPKSSYFGDTQKSTNMSEAEVVGGIMRGHEPMITVLKNRTRSLQVFYSVWQSKGVKSALESAIAINDLAILVDILGIMASKTSLWSLDICVIILPKIYELLQSRYETYMQTGCNSLRLILQNFSAVIKSNVQTPCGSFGVDIPREERYKKCKSCHDNLLSIRAFVLKRQTMQGTLGSTFRDLHKLMETLD